MDNAIYAGLSRQSGLMAEMTAIANNIANANTTGYRAEGVIFSEYVRGLAPDTASLSMAAARVRQTDFTQGGIETTGAPFDLAIEGEGFFLVATPQGDRLTRAGSFLTNDMGDLVTPQGHPVLDAGGAPIAIPMDAGPVTIGGDGTLSVGGDPLGQLAVVAPLDPLQMSRGDGVLFNPGDGWQPVDAPRILQGAVESANTDTVGQIARMIEVQRAYELGQNFLDREDERIRAVITSLKR